MSPADWLDAVLREPGTLLLGDGAMGTMLQAAGLPLGKAPEQWNVDRPDEVVRVHRAYAGAGARWSVANTFGGNRTRLAISGLADRLTAVNAEAVRCAREGAPRLRALGSLGPTGSPEPRVWDADYSEQAAALAENGIDGFVVET
ncbi:MAG TPA: homocysteine S-methyltransferase family protein, partial [Armatimonadota bacterium]|nr:homocysteine S-methyltransferase family protein [Armatimonadota bacterium]